MKMINKTNEIKLNNEDLSFILFESKREIFIFVVLIYLIIKLNG